MPSEITVIIKDEEKTLRKNFLIYESYSVHESDPIIKSCIDDVLKNFSSEPKDINVKIHLEIQ
jgi:hypothetical protein